MSPVPPLSPGLVGDGLVASPAPAPGGHRQIMLDTETTGLDVAGGHRLTEIGCVELVRRRPTGRRFHRYINPQRQLDARAREITGLSEQFLADKPLFAEIAEEFLEFIQGAELIIHNAAFDVGFLEHELALCGARITRLRDCARVTDTFAMARERFPGKRVALDALAIARRKHPMGPNSLDALCRRYGIDNSHRTVHGALLDAELLAEVYLAMTRGQESLGIDLEESREMGARGATPLRPRPTLIVLSATADEEAAHVAMLEGIAQAWAARQAARRPACRHR